MPDVISYILGLPFGVGFAALGRWVFFHPEKALEKFNPYGKPYGSFWVKQAKLTGLVWLFISVYVIAGLLVWPLHRLVPESVGVGFLLCSAGLVSWQLLKRPRATRLDV